MRHLQCSTNDAHNAVRGSLVFAFVFFAFAGPKGARFSGRHEYKMSMYIYSTDCEGGRGVFFTLGEEYFLKSGAERC